MSSCCYQRIKDARDDSDLTQDQVAEFLGIKQPQYSRYERGENDVPARILVQLADIFNTSTDYLLGRTKNPNPPKDE